MRIFPEITTENLIIRLPDLKDIPEVLCYFRENEVHLSPFNPKKPENFYTEDFWRDRISRYHEMYQLDQEVRFYLFAAKNRKEVVGTLEFSQISRGPFQSCYLGYGIAKKYERRGLMYEGVKAAIDFAFGSLNLHRIMANHLPENERSAGLLKKLGFVKECTAKNYLRFKGEWRDHVLNSLTNADWRDSE